MSLSLSRQPCWPKVPVPTGLPCICEGDRRHIQERDVRVLREVLAVPLNVECAASPEAMAAIVPLKPHWVTLVPETREELTTQGGLDVRLPPGPSPLCDPRAADL